MPRAIGSERMNPLRRKWDGEAHGVHAYLHRKEGDQENAAYWYAGAGKTVCVVPLDAERYSIVNAPLHSNS
jgi:hypothetical protein